MFWDSTKDKDGADKIQLERKAYTPVGVPWRDRATLGMTMPWDYYTIEKGIPPGNASTEIPPDPHRIPNLVIQIHSHMN